MALLTTWTDNNKVIEQGLTITYSVSKTFGTWTATSSTASSAVEVYTQAWEIRRFAKATFKYVGLDYTSAKSCAQAMATAYTRTTKVSVWDPTGQSMYDPEFVDIDGGSVLMADISIQHVEGHMYEVIISIGEEDTRMRRHLPVSVESLFTTENNRTYSGL